GHDRDAGHLSLPKGRHRRERPRLRQVRSHGRASQLHGSARSGRRAFALECLPPARDARRLNPREIPNPKPADTLHNESSNPMTALIVPIAVFLCVACLIGAAATWLTARTEPGVEDRLAVLTGSTSGKQAKDALL